jgi:hypothetical protein
MEIFPKSGQQNLCKKDKGLRVNSPGVKQATALNGICPYFTMFPLDFPLNILRNRARIGEAVLDPFCGRGTTNFAARLMGLNSFGVDASPIAVAITAAKLVWTDPIKIVAEAETILAHSEPDHPPEGEFWELAYHPAVLKTLCCLRRALLDDCRTAERIALRSIILGALHGPKQKTFQSYFSNQCPRTYSPKPAYATKFWREHNLQPEGVDVLDIIKRRAKRYYTSLPVGTGSVRQADSRASGALSPDTPKSLFNWVITSPPYYGMRTYIPDQWLRNWFLGGPDHVDYDKHNQLSHSSPDEFIRDLGIVWRNAAGVCSGKAVLVARFGGISDRKANPLDLIKASLKGSGWKLQTIHKAGSAIDGKRQADSFLRRRSKPMLEYDVWAVRY